jgi:plasmid stabilization system protein ParE
LAAEEALRLYQRYALISPELGEKAKVELDNAIHGIAENPFLCHNRGNGIFSVRTKVFPYTLYYKLKDDQIRILAVLHGHQNPRTWKRRK